jgi:hypothetical protein
MVGRPTHAAVQTGRCRAANAAEADTSGCMHHSSRSRREPYVHGSERLEMKGSRGAMEKRKRRGEPRRFSHTRSNLNSLPTISQIESTSHFGLSWLKPLHDLR